MGKVRYLAILILPSLDSTQEIFLALRIPRNIDALNPYQDHKLKKIYLTMQLSYFFCNFIKILQFPASFV